MSFLAKVRYSISAKILSDEYYDSSKLRDILSKQLPRVRLIKHGIIAAAKYDHIDFKPSKATSNGQYGKNVHITAITAKQLSTVYHIGSLKRPSKKSFSLEGAGVSVSVDPLAWIKIVKLGGHDVWKLEKANPKFLMWSKTNDKKALTWAVQNAWLVAAIRYQTSFYSDEMEDEMMTDHDTREEAEKEAFDGEVAEIKSYKLGQKGMEYWKKTFSSKPSNSIAIALAIVWYAEAHNFDGVWWQETYDPSSFSAPRGVIFDITKWKKTKLKEGEYSDYHSD